jgi:hypothetical protein
MMLHVCVLLADTMEFYSISSILSVFASWSLIQFLFTITAPSFTLNSSQHSSEMLLNFLSSFGLVFPVFAQLHVQSRTPNRQPT